MQASLTLAPILDVRYSHLVTMQIIPKTLPFDYASYQIHTSKLNQAIETLDLGPQ
jgi:hypothetical protein